MKPDGPAERLLVDDEDQQQREHDAERQPGDVGQQADQPGFDQNEFANLRYGRAQKAQQAQFAAAIDDQRQQRAGDSDDGDDDGDDLQRVGDGEGAIENLDGLVRAGCDW